MHIASSLLKWFDQKGRKHLPWQHNKTPYRIWVSEIMLQQTQVSTVIHYFERFMTRFPTLTDLAYATEDEVLHYWTGLGYYSRARNLLRAAKQVMSQYNGNLPQNLEQLQTLPGIGRSTAGAILAIGFSQSATILDGNVKRVLCRLFAIKEWSGEKKTLNYLWKLAEQFTPIRRIADYTQAIMDLGATICVRGQPHCTHCPLLKNCKAKKLQLEKILPKPRPKKLLPIRQTTFLLLFFQGKILLEKRSSAGVWKGLWSLPEVQFKELNAIKKYCFEFFNLNVEHAQNLSEFRHTFTHFHLNIFPVLLHCKKKVPILEKIWYDLNAPIKLGLPAPVKKLLEKIPLS